MKGIGPLHGVGVLGLVSRVLAFSPMGLHGDGKGIYSPDRPSLTSTPPGLNGGGQFSYCTVGLPRGNRTLGTEDPTGFRGTARAVRASRHFIVQMRRLVVGGCPTGVSYRLLHDTGHAPTNRKTGPGGERETDRIGSDGPVLLSVP